MTLETDAVFRRLPRPEACCSWHTALFCNPKKGPKREKQTGDQAYRSVLSHRSDEQNVPGRQSERQRVLGHRCGGQKMQDRKDEESLGNNI